jgi:hypothetical protein
METKSVERYPMSLYAGGNAGADHVIVRSSEDEIAARAKGYKGIPGSSAETQAMPEQKPAAPEKPAETKAEKKAKK